MVLFGSHVNEGQAANLRITANFMDQLNELMEFTGVCNSVARIKSNYYSYRDNIALGCHFISATLTGTFNNQQLNRVFNNIDTFKDFLEGLGILQPVPQVQAVVRPR